MQKLVDSPGAPLMWNVQKMDVDKFAEKLARRFVILKVLDQNGRDFYDERNFESK